MNGSREKGREPGRVPSRFHCRTPQNVTAAGSILSGVLSLTVQFRQLRTIKEEQAGVPLLYETCRDRRIDC
jgi:hypothetical protein